ncbi:lipopolysaccharide biosynthesis protein [Longibaculum muris]|uniref:lipopolysaccharide biosynthesis protein n=1 Tax=Longibaculum muris TaxID=1796628 RepID=UPI003AB72D18
MSDNGMKSITVKNMIWRFAERCAAQAVSFLVSITLARLISPEQYGSITLIMVFTSILQVFVDSGLGNALIQKRDSDDLDFSSVFYFNFIICILLYILMFVLSPFIGDFYEDKSLIPLTRVISLTLIISGVKGIQQAYVSKHMLFKRFFYSTLGGTIFSAIVGIAMAYNGFGCWALVAQQLSNVTIDTMILWLTVKWRPKLIFSFERLKVLFSYGWKLLVSALFDTGYNNLRNLIIGKVYSPADLAFYNKGQQFPSLIVTNINTSIDSVLLPVMASAQDNANIVKKMTRKSIKMSGYVMWPLMVGLAVCAKPIVVLLLTEKWIDSIFFLRVFCFTYVLWPIHTANLNAIKAMGRSDEFLKLEVIKKCVGIISILISLPFGVHAMAIAYLITAPISAIINAFPNKKLLNYTFKEQIEDILPYIGLSLIMAALIWPIQNLPLDNLMILVIQVVIGAMIYIIGSKIFKLDMYFELLNMVKLKK